MFNLNEMLKQKGFVLYENASIVVIATIKSTNKKTGEMVQIWILVKSVDPVTASRKKLDFLNCGDCKHRHNKNGACYVNLGQAPLMIYKSYKKGLYYNGVDSVEQFIKVVKSKDLKIRWGAYGDPSFIPQNIVNKINQETKTEKNSFNTGYSHQWHKVKVSKSFMASVDSKHEKARANAKGYRTFRVTLKNDLAKDEIFCPSDTNKNITCKTCGLCDGSRNAKNIAILVHGSRKKNFSSVAR